MKPTLPETRQEDIDHRNQVEAFVCDSGDKRVASLLEHWHQGNADYFDGAFQAAPVILLAEPTNPRRLGDYAVTGGNGSRAQIRIRPSLLRGTHPDMRAGDKYAEGRFLFVSDVLLHEMLHQYQHEILGDLEDAYKGHGPKFRDKCNQIGEKLGLPPVRTCKARGKDKDLPSCSYWPHIVRPAEFVPGRRVSTRKTGRTTEPSPRAETPPSAFLGSRHRVRAPSAGGI